MNVILVCHHGTGDRASIHLVNEDGKRMHSARTVQHALRWLWERGDREIVAMTDIGPELFLIEACAGLTLTLPSLSMRRAFHGRCDALAGKLGIGPDPTLRARVLDAGAPDRAAAQRRRKRWLRRATTPAIIGAANDD